MRPIETEEQKENKYFKNEIFCKLEDYINTRRIEENVDKNTTYEKRVEIFEGIELGIEAFTIMQWLKQFVETETCKFECL